MTIWRNSTRTKHAQRVTCTTRPPPPFKFSTHVKQTIFLDISDTAGPYSIFIFLLSQTKPITQPPFPLQIVKAGWREWKASNCFYDRVRDVNRAGRQSGGAEEGPYDSGIQLQTKDVGLSQKSWRTTPPHPPPIHRFVTMEACDCTTSSAAKTLYHHILVFIPNSPWLALLTSRGLGDHKCWEGAMLTSGATVFMALSQVPHELYMSSHCGVEELWM